MITLFISSASLLFAETNALIEVKLFKDWEIKGERGFGNLTIKNTGTAPILLAKDASIFDGFQLHARSFPAKRAEYREDEIESDYRILRSMEEFEFFSLLPGETHVYEGRKFYLSTRSAFSEEMRFIVSIYLGNGFWLDSEPLVVKGVVAASEEYLATVLGKTVGSELASEKRSGFNIWDMVAVTYKNERWLYKKSTDSPHSYYPICPLSLTNKIRIEEHEGENLFKIWDGDNSMILHFTKSMLLEGPDENDVLGKWTRERKQQAEADNAKVRRKKQEAQ
ncbi:MAG: hypothetical protein FWH21_05110 [Kiritimatiellaeota bacterium]|nr:hypothetical protein [Kiritimatiellota bacterium]